MNNKLKKSVIFLLGIMLIMQPLPAFGADEEEETDAYKVDAYIDDALSPYRCIAQGNTDFILFLGTLIWSDSFWEGVIEPFVDVINRNQCHGLDVLNLIKQRDKIRASIRKAFLTCKNDQLPNLKRALYELNVEIYYIRHVVDGSVIGGLPFTSLSLYNSAYFYPREKLYKEMFDKYVTRAGYFSKINFDVLFRKLEAKYKTRKNSYILCEKSSWAAVSEKWEEFVDTAGGLGPAIDSFEKGVGGRAEKFWEAMTDLTYVDYMSAIVQVNLNGQPFMEEFGEILDNIKESLELPGDDYEGVDTSQSYVSATRKQVVGALIETDYQFRIDSLERDIKSKFKVLYKDTGDSASTTFLEELDTLNSIIIDTFTGMDSVLTCVKFMNDKQCPGN